MGRRFVTLPFKASYYYFSWRGNGFDFRMREIRMRRYTHKPVGPLIISEAPCLVGGQCGICLLNISFIF